MTKKVGFFDYQKELDQQKQNSDPMLKRDTIIYSTKGSPARTFAKQSLTYLNFLDQLIDIWNQKMENDRPEGDPLRDVKIVRRYSVDEDKEVNAIVYRLMERKPSGTHKERDFRLKEIIPDPHREGESLEVYGLMYEVDIEFRVLSQKSADADKIVKEFSTFLLAYRPVLARQGVSHFHFIRQGPDEKDMTHRGKNHIRPIYYKFFIEEFDYVSQRDIKSIEALVSNKD